MRGLLLALLLVVPLAASHGGEHLTAPIVEKNIQLRYSTNNSAGIYSAYLFAEPSPLYANTPGQGFTLQVRRAGALYPEAESTLMLSAPNASWREKLTFAPASASYSVATVTIPEPGKYNGRLVVTGDHEEYNNTEFEVFPDLPFRLRPLGSPVVFANESTTLSFETIGKEDLQRYEATPSLNIAVELWTPNHQTKVSTTEVAATTTSPGIWRFTYVFGSVGHYYLRFASDDGGFNYDDVPPFHVDVDAPLAVEAKKPTTAWGLLGVVGAAALAVAVVRRRG